jgi:tRNA A37 threonylcarbamoyladenosine dehydratase
MSQQLISRSPDLKRLRDEGYNIEVRAGHLLVKDVPYVNERCEVQRGTLVSILTLNGDVTQRPGDHVVYFAGDYPCNRDGSRITQIQHTSKTQEIVPGVVTNHSFSSKPESGYPNYYEKMTTYANILSSPAQTMDPKATPTTFPVVKDDAEESVFEYVDTASSRAGIAAVTAMLSSHRVAIVGLGGTGAYILDLLAKTPVREIHLYDGDDFLQHNAFRAPGAASAADLDKHLKKVDYYARIYSCMRKGVIPHSYNVDESKIDELATAGFVFLCLDGGQAKKAIVNGLQALGIPFIDCGIDVYFAEEKLAGQVRVTTSTTDKKDHVRKYVWFMDTDGGDNEYAKNIQIADLNALTATFAVIKWKKLCGYYHDFEREHHTMYTIDGNTVNNEECP